MLEKTIENYLKREVKKRKGEAIKLIGIVGLPDRMILLPEKRICFVELKRPGEKPRPIQLWWLRRFKELGFLSGWCDSKESVDRLLEVLDDVQLPKKSC